MCFLLNEGMHNLISINLCAVLFKYIIMITDFEILGIFVTSIVVLLILFQIFKLSKVLNTWNFTVLFSIIFVILLLSLIFIKHIIQTLNHTTIFKI